MIILKIFLSKNFIKIYSKTHQIALLKIISGEYVMPPKRHNKYSTTIYHYFLY